MQLTSNGRFILGLGAGWHKEEYEAYGYEFPSACARVEQLEETLDLVREAGFSDVEAHADFRFEAAADDETSYVVLGKRLS